MIILKWSPQTVSSGRLIRMGSWSENFSTGRCQRDVYLSVHDIEQTGIDFGYGSNSQSLHSVEIIWDSFSIILFDIFLEGFPKIDVMNITDYVVKCLKRTCEVNR